MSTHARKPASPIEPLESRRHLSVTFENGVIRVVTGDKKDVILGEAAGATRFRLNVNGETRTYDNKVVSLITIETNASADRVDLSNVKVRAMIDGGKGPDTILGGRRADTLIGDGGPDSLYGNEDADVIEGGLQADTLDGGFGDDRIIPYSTPSYDDSVFGGEGADTVDYSQETKDLTIEVRDDGDEPQAVVTDQIAGDVEVILCGSGNDVVTSLLSTGLRVDGGAGNDSLTGGAGADTLIGGAGRDSLYGGAGNDRFTLGAVDGLVDLVDGGDGDDAFIDTTADSADSILNVP